MSAREYKRPEEATLVPARPWLIFLLCVIWFGLLFTEGISNNLLPLTISNIVNKPWVIGLLLGLNPMFGFIAQPLVGVWSDVIWTPIGRRAFFIIISAPIVALCLVFVPYAATVWQIFILVLIYQFFQDIIFGSDQPLLADLIPARQRSLVMGLLVVAQEASTYCVLKIGMGYMLKKWGQESVYVTAAILQIIFVMLAAFFLKEKPPRPRSRSKLTVKRYVMDLFGDPILRKLGIIHFTKAFLLTMVQGFIALYAVKTLLVDKSVFGKEWAALPLIMLILAFPVGWLVEKLSRQWVMVAALGLMILACFFGYRAASPDDLLVVAVLFGCGLTIERVTYKPFLTEHFPADIIGQLAGAVNICHAVGKTSALWLGGVIVSLVGGDYHIIWIIAGIFGVISIALMITVPDLRYMERKAKSRQ